ncbi:MAG: hypothetical protein HRS57_03370, partial [Mycoplasmataceae bacterium]|nr:hypothetical protein [Mycoplasmataceae bacterium]
QFFADYPQTRMLLAFDTSAGTLSRLKNNKADIILNCHTGALEKSYCRHPLNTIDFMPVCHRDYYREHKHHLLDNSIVLISETGFEDQNVSEGILKNMTPLLVNDLSIKKQCIHSKLGWGRLPKHLIEDELASGEFHTINNTGFENRVMTMQLIHKDSTFLGPVTQKLISTIKNHPWWRSIENVYHPSLKNATIGCKPCTIHLGLLSTWNWVDGNNNTTTKAC